MKINMKRFNLFLVSLLIIISASFYSCDNNDGYSIGDIGMSWATVRVLSDNAYYLDSDRYGTLWLSADAARWYKPVEGERVISYFNPLADNYNGYDMAVKLEAIYPILTKDIAEITPENEEEFGNDPIVIYKGNLWVSNGYMNIIFRQDMPLKDKHFINLVQGESIDGDNEDYVYLALRYNTYNDVSGYWQNGAVSFNLNTIDLPEKKGIILRLNSKENGEVELEINLSQADKPSTTDFSSGTPRETMIK